MQLKNLFIHLFISNRFKIVSIMQLKNGKKQHIKMLVLLIFNVNFLKKWHNVYAICLCTRNRLLILELKNPVGKSIGTSWHLSESPVFYLLLIS